MKPIKKYKKEERMEAFLLGFSPVLSPQRIP
jgi:hypothetical protein